MLAAERKRIWAIGRTEHCRLNKKTRICLTREIPVRWDLNNPEAGKEFLSWLRQDNAMTLMLFSVTAKTPTARRLYGGC